jgi:uncharacterized protein (TIGR03067 family)
MKQCSLAILTAGLLLGTGTGADAPENDQDRVQGTWVRRWAVNDGEDIPDDGIQVTFKGDRMTLRLGKDKKHEATFKLDPGKEPKEITMFEGTKQRKGIYAFGGYRLGGEYLQLCFGAPGAERPKRLWYEKGSKTLFLWLDPKHRKGR